MAIIRVGISKRKQRLSIHVCWGIIIAAVTIGHRMFDLPACLFHQIMGIPCLSCGSGRAIEAFWNGDFFTAISLNPLIVFSALALFLFSLLKVIEYIFSFNLEFTLEQSAATGGRILFALLIAANWAYLILCGR